MNARLLLKRTAQAIALIVVFPLALLSGFGRIGVVYALFAQMLALSPGMPGNLLRSAFYRLTLDECSIDTTICFGTIFTHSGARVGPYVSIGLYCVIGRASIGERTQIASHVTIPSGRHQHERDETGALVGSTHSITKVGANCWIGASALILADTGAGCTIGAGAVVVKEIPAGSVAVGNPARVVRSGT